jgi:hypothetical protein
LPAQSTSEKGLTPSQPMQLLWPPQTPHSSQTELEETAQVASTGAPTTV